MNTERDLKFLKLSDISYLTEGVIPKSCVRLVEKYIKGDTETRQMIEELFPELQWKNLRFALFMEMIDGYTKGNITTVDFVASDGNKYEFSIKKK
jgi:hypothetical protein